MLPVLLTRLWFCTMTAAPRTCTYTHSTACTHTALGARTHTQTCKHRQTGSSHCSSFVYTLTFSQHLSYVLYTFGKRGPFSNWGPYCSFCYKSPVWMPKQTHTHTQYAWNPVHTCTYMYTAMDNVAAARPLLRRLYVYWVPVKMFAAANVQPLKKLRRGFQLLEIMIFSAISDLFKCFLE